MHKYRRMVQVDNIQRTSEEGQHTHRLRPQGGKKKVDTKSI